MSKISSSSEKNTQASQIIPVKRVVVDDPSQLPLDYGTTPGGTLFSTTPGGTRIMYDRAFLMQCRKSPHTLSPPAHLPSIPGVTSARPGAGDMQPVPENGESHENGTKGANDSRDGHVDEPQFDMDV